MVDRYKVQDCVSMFVCMPIDRNIKTLGQG